MSGLSGPAARASVMTLFSSAPQPSRTQTGFLGQHSAAVPPPKCSASFLGSLHFAVQQPHGPDGILNRRPQKLGAFAAHPGGIVDQTGLPVAEFRLPLAALAGLQAVLVIEFHQRTRRHQAIQQLREPAPQRGAILCQVLDQQIGQGIRRGSNPDIDAGLSGKLADQEDQGTQPELEASIGRAVILLDDRLVYLAQQHAGLQQVGRDFLEQEIRWYDRAGRIVGGVADSVVDNTQLGAKLTGRARAVDRPQSMLPEAPRTGSKG